MPTHSSHVRLKLAVSVLFCCAGWFGIANAAQECEPIRPPGLTSQQAEQIVLERIAEAIGIPITKIDRTRSIQDLIGTDDAIIWYTRAVVFVGDTLGIDSGAAFDKAAEARGKVHPSKSLSVSELQSLARQAYSIIPDTPYPAVKSGAKFHTRRFIASAPSPPDGWIMLRCYYDQFTFQRRDEKTGELFSASASDVALEPFKGKVEFLTQVRAAGKSVAPPGFTVKSINAEILEQAGPPCALLEIQAEGATPTTSETGVKPATILARFCYDTKFQHLGYMALFSYVGSLPVQAIRQQATAYFSGVTAAR